MLEIKRQSAAYEVLRTALVTVCLVALAGCVEEPEPRSFSQFLVDAIARQATLVRCNEDRAGTASDLECSNARRAAAAIAAQAEAKRRAELEAESERQRAAARARVAAQQEAAREAAEAARRAAEAAYEQQYLYGGSKIDTIELPPTDGEPETPGAAPPAPSPRVVQPGPDAAIPRESASDTGSAYLDRQAERARMPQAGSP